MSEKDLIGALESIIVRCREGAKGTDWLPTIADIAERALKKAKSAPPAAVPDSVRRDAEMVLESVLAYTGGELRDAVERLARHVLAKPKERG